MGNTLNLNYKQKSKVLIYLGCHKPYKKVDILNVGSCVLKPIGEDL